MFQGKKVCPIMLLGNYGMIQITILNLFPKGCGRKTIISKFTEKNGEQINYKGEEIILRLTMVENGIFFFLCSKFR